MLYEFLLFRKSFKNKKNYINLYIQSVNHVIVLKLNLLIKYRFIIILVNWNIIFKFILNVLSETDSYFTMS